ncbi:hypothetical protein NEAUS03_1498 [Nematocida ausubeli]|nr:hypothetical protein NEAUS03_1498 [Nematocida ausubeli]
MTSLEKTSNRKESRIQKNLYGERNRRAYFHVAGEHSEAKVARRGFLGLPIRVLFVIFIFTVQQAYTILTRNDAEKLQQMVVHAEENVEWVVNSDGPLSPFGLYLYNKTDYMHISRLFNIEIDPYYNMSDRNNNNQFIRDPTKDEAFILYSNNIKLKNFITAQHTALINMFPSPNQIISIYPEKDCKDSFTLFLKSDPVKEHAHTILAALLLRAEGMNIPLFIRRNKMQIPHLIWKGGAQKTENFSLEIVVPCSEMQEDDFRRKRCEPLRYKSEQVIWFFLHTNLMLKDGIEDSMTTEEKIEFWENVFCDSKSWLIGSYLYYYLETKEDAAHFNKTVYKMLDEHIKRCERKNKDEQKAIGINFFNKCFMQCDSLSDELKYWRKIEELEGTIESMEKVRLLPFTDSKHALIRTTADVQICDDTYLTTDVFLTDVESALLGLFCCFAHDPNCVLYSLDHMENAPKDVKNFFSNTPSSLPACILNRAIGVKENLNRTNPLGSIKFRPEKEIPMPVQQAWKKIVRDICSANLRFSELNDGKVLAGGFLNVLTAILQLAGEYTNENKEKIESFKDKLFRMIKEEKINYSIVEDIQDYTEKLFASLSRKCTPCNGLIGWYKYKLDERKREGKERKREIFISFICSGQYIENHRADLYGSMQIYYAYKNQAQPIILHLMNSKLTHLEIGKKVVKLDKSKAEEREEIKKELELSLKENSFIQHILFDYIKKIENYALSEYVVFDSYIIENVNPRNRNVLLYFHSIQPTKHIHADMFSVVECLLRNKYTTPNYIKFWTHQETNLSNILIRTPVSNIENLLFLIVCIGCKKGNAEDNLEEIQEAIPKDSDYEFITIEAMVKIVSILLRFDANINLANVLAAYAQIYWSSDKMCIAKIVRKLPARKDRILKCLDQYMTVKGRKPAKKENYNVQQPKNEP